MISVVIPTFNNSNTIVQAIQSVLNQGCSDYEVIVVDDGSTDDTSRVLESYIRDGILRYYKKENGGCASARNFGIKEAKGEVIAFLDADDEWLEGHLETKYRLLLTCNYDWVAGGFYKRFPDGTLEYRTITTSDKIKWDDTLGFQLLGNGVFWFSSFPIQLNTVLFKKDAIMAVNLFDESFVTSEDWDLYLRAEEAGLRAGFNDAPSAIYNFNPSSITKSKKHDCIKDQLLLARRHSEILDLNLEHVRRSYADFVWHAGRTYLAGGEVANSIKCFARSMCIDFDLNRVLNPIYRRIKKS